MIKRSSRQFGDFFSGFGRQGEKSNRIGACIRRNFTPCFHVESPLSRQSLSKDYPRLL